MWALFWWPFLQQHFWEETMFRLHALLSVVAVAILMSAVSTPAQPIISEWSGVKAPPAPELKTVKIEPKTTALLMLDFVKQSCNEQRRPRCLATLSKVENLLAEARANDMLVVYSIVRGATIRDTLPAVAPIDKEPFVQSGADKFYETNLEQILKDKNIQTVIVVGTAAHGVVMYTASGAAFRGMNVIVPLDGMSAENTYIEQYVAYNFTSAPGVAGKVTLTSVDMVKF
jgi:nicotinamidase-related amidase